MSILLAISAALLGAIALGNLIWMSSRILRGSRIVIPWTAKGIPERCWLSQRRRTRDGSHLMLRRSGYCALIFWKASPCVSLDIRIVDLLTGFSNAEGLGIDFSHTGGNESWLITSHAITTPQWSIDGPHFAPLSAWHRPAWARVDISSLIDVERLRTDMELSVSRSSIRHRGLDPLGYMLGLTRPDRVTCSGLIGGAILLQRGTRLANALSQALRERFTYGEITPADLARAAAILGLVPEGETRTIATIPIVAFGRPSGSLSQTEPRAH
jgi:hypothetical protein